tara:strand:- start:465 stop:677 length:213 start_codon:yes stop_codon:yes gene_type:complete
MVEIEGDVVFPKEMDVSSMLKAPGSVAVTMDNLGVDDITVTTVKAWLKVLAHDGTGRFEYWIPAWRGAGI